MFRVRICMQHLKIFLLYFLIFHWDLLFIVNIKITCTSHHFIDCDVLTCFEKQMSISSCLKDSKTW
jgi:hypothetical protein